MKTLTSVVTAFLLIAMMLALIYYSQPRDPNTPDPKEMSELRNAVPGDLVVWNDHAGPIEIVEANTDGLITFRGEERRTEHFTNLSRKVFHVIPKKDNSQEYRWRASQFVGQHKPLFVIRRDTTN